MVVRVEMYKREDLNNIILEPEEIDALLETDKNFGVGGGGIDNVHNYGNGRLGYSGVQEAIDRIEDLVIEKGFVETMKG